MLEYYGGTRIIVVLLGQNLHSADKLDLSRSKQYSIKGVHVYQPTQLTPTQPTHKILENPNNSICT